MMTNLDIWVKFKTLFPDLKHLVDSYSIETHRKDAINIKLKSGQVILFDVNKNGWTLTTDRNTKDMLVQEYIRKKSTK